MDPAPKSSPDHPLERGVRGRGCGGVDGERGRDGHQTGVESLVPGFPNRVLGAGKFPTAEAEGEKKKVEFASVEMMVRSGSLDCLKRRFHSPPAD